MASTTTHQTHPGPIPLFKPTLILHGGAGAIHRSTLPPELYKRYHASLLTYLQSTYTLLTDGGATALDAAVHCVSLLEDDELFNCGRGSVFTSAGTIEMEASVMVTSVRTDLDNDSDSDNSNDGLRGGIKRGAGVIKVKNVRHPIQLAREALLRTGVDENGNPTPDAARGGNMHSQLSGPYVETLARDWGLDFMPDDWFWTQRRWDEHRRGLRSVKENVTMSQGTVGCVCLDQWGNLATAMSTGGLTNKMPGRVGDTPTLGAGFWAESWTDVRNVEDEEGEMQRQRQRQRQMVYAPSSSTTEQDGIGNERMFGLNWSVLSPWNLIQDLLFLDDCLPDQEGDSHIPSAQQSEKQPLITDALSTQPLPPKRIQKAIALSGTGNGDSFLRVNAARTAGAMLRFSPPAKNLTLAKTVSAIAGRGGELQRSAGRRWGKTAEGQGGIIGIEVELDNTYYEGRKKAARQEGEQKRGTGRRIGRVVFDFNCGAMFRAWMDGEKERVMVFRDEYDRYDIVD